MSLKRKDGENNKRGTTFLHGKLRKDFLEETARECEKESVVARSLIREALDYRIAKRTNKNPFFK